MLTPADIEKKEFKKEMRGYSIPDVNNFLHEVANCYEKIYQENLAAIKTRCPLQRVREMKSALTRTNRRR